MEKKDEEVRHEQMFSEAKDINSKIIDSCK